MYTIFINCSFIFLFMADVIDPYSSELVSDYQKIVDDFGLEKFDVSMFPEPNRVMRRGEIFAGRDAAVVAKCIADKKKFYALSGIMPSGEKIHLGNKLIVENMKYFQDHGAKTVMLIADLEASAARGVSLEDAKRRAMEFHVPAYIALGLDPKKTLFYFQSENKQVMHLGFEFSKKITLNEFRAIYGNADPGRIMSAVTQVADILYPQMDERMPGIIPVGIDQDPHIRLTRDIVRRVKEKKFFMPSSIYNKFTPSLDGSLKMSKSKPESCLELPEDVKGGCKKLSKALTGGRESAEVQRSEGGQPDKCIIYYLYRSHLIEDDSALKERFNLCVSGKVLCGECKQHCCELYTKFMTNFTKKLEHARENIDKVKFLEF